MMLVDTIIKGNATGDVSVQSKDYVLACRDAVNKHGQDVRRCYLCQWQAKTRCLCNEIEELFVVDAELVRLHDILQKKQPLAIPAPLPVWDKDADSEIHDCQPEAPLVRMARLTELVLTHRFVLRLRGGDDGHDDLWFLFERDT